MERPRLEIVRPDDEVIDIYLNGKEITSVCYDLHGLRGMEAVVEAVTALAQALGADVVEASEPSRQQYTYFVAYDWVRSGSVGAANGRGCAWLTRDRPIEGPADTEAIIRGLVAESNFSSVIITNFICTDGPS